MQRMVSGILSELRVQKLLADWLLSVMYDSGVRGLLGRARIFLSFLQGAWYNRARVNHLTRKGRILDGRIRYRSRYS